MTVIQKKISWANIGHFHAKNYVCGYCNKNVGPNTGYHGQSDTTHTIYICSYCTHPTYFYFDAENGEEFQIPSPVFGEDVNHLPEKVESLYSEARRCMTISAYTSAVMLCRILLMHISVEKGANENMNFQQYVDWLDNSGYVPPDGKHLLEYIRKRGNDANHKIHIMHHQDAQNLIIFIGLFMKFVYEYPSLIPQNEVIEQNL